MPLNVTDSWSELDHRSCLGSSLLEYVTPLLSVVDIKAQPSHRGDGSSEPGLARDGDTQNQESTYTVTFQCCQVSKLSCVTPKQDR